MTADDILEVLDKAGVKHGYYPVTIAIAPSKETDPAALETKLTPWLIGAGWIARQSGVGVLAVGEDGAGDDPTLGQVVSAELSLGDRSLQVRRGTGGWTLVEIVESKGETHLADTVEHVTLKSGRAVYHRYWSLDDPDGATEIVGWRFVKFVGMGQ